MSEQQINEQIETLEKEIAAAEAATEETQNNETPSEESSNPAVSTLENDADLKQIIESRVQEQVNKEKAAFKAKLDELYKARDEAIKEKVALQEEKRQAEIKRMEEEGRHKEVAELKMAELQAKLETAQKENTRLSRDHAVTEAMRSMDFRSDIASEMARDRVISQLQQDENGQWVHRSGISIKEFVEHFSKDEENSFLFKAKTNSGAGSQQAIGTPQAPSSNKAITEMTTEELLTHFARQKPEGHMCNY